MDTSNIGNARQQNDNRIALLNGRWLAECWRELCATYERTDLQASDYTPAQMAMYRSLQSEPDTLEAQSWIKTCLFADKATNTIRNAIMLGDLQLWYIAEAREVPLAPFVIDKPNVKHGVFKSVERPAPEIQGAKLWVKLADWSGFLARTVVPNVDQVRLPTEHEFVPLSEALTWIAFRVAMNSDVVHELLRVDSFGGRAPEEAIQDALQDLIRQAGSGSIAIRGKYKAERGLKSTALLTETIAPIKFENYRQYCYIEDELRHGQTSLTWHKQDRNTFHFLLGSGRSDSFVQVAVRRVDLMRAYPAQLAQRCDKNAPQPSQSFSRDDPTHISPWWSVNQALVWVATGIASFVESVGKIEAEHPGEHGAYIVQAICEAQVADSDEGRAFMVTRRDRWPDGAYLAQAGRDLLGEIAAGAVRPAVRERGTGRRMSIEEFAGIGLNVWGGDWLELSPRPFFQSAELMKVFMATDVPSTDAIGEKASANRQLNHDEIRSMAEAMRRERPKLSKGAAAASIVSILPPNRKTGRPRDYRHIERIIAPLWERGF